MKEYLNSEITALINEHIHSKRDRDILIDRLVNGKTFDKLAEDHDMSLRQIQRIVYKNQEIVFLHMK